MKLRIVRLSAVCVWALAASGGAAADLPEVVARIKPSVVAVGTYDRARSPPFRMRGTGFVVGNGTLVATSAHVLPEMLDPEGGETLVVVAQSGSPAELQRPAQRVAIDKTHDLAVLRIDGAPMQAMALNGSGPVREGQSIAFIGFPIGGVLGMSPVTHRGIISSITPITMPGQTAQQLNEKTIRRLKSGSFDVYQLDGTAYPGNSGGPVFDVENGVVLGIVNMVFIKATKEAVLTQPSGISFAVPAGYLQLLLRQLD